ncbi:methionine adenosyltransferase [Pontibacter sp. G13]|uniref:methionine adenosyltransferase n=1 Tax=Pontibacter sp. G13 TaxID=3074898 RepID=UPI00288A1994|nr:methionine adenosyltransferase [Pontibacter sp. G13]WNJ20407.1 methionine adenosyltransferase [Pontibacter sp. G13]
MPYLFTSESVSEGHPDKVADQISDAVLDAMLQQDPDSRVACETLVTTGQVVLAGEVSTKAYVDLQQVVRDTIERIGYTSDEYQFSSASCSILSALHEQSADIARGVDSDESAEKDQGAGDQGMMFGYANNETEEYMPMALAYSHKLVMELANIRKNEPELMPYLRPDSKSQVTIEYGDDGKAIRVHTIVISTQHDDFIQPADDSAAAEEEADRQMLERIREDIITHLIPRVIKPEHIQDTIYHINPTGKFVIGGPHGDAGLTGRKIIVDTYGGKGAHGGGAFSGKDASKVDRSAAYAARHIAKNIVASGIADEALVQLAYAIGVAEPVSIFVDTYGTSKVNISDSEIAEKIKSNLSFTPTAIVERLGLNKPVFSPSAAYGHMGRTSYEKEVDLKYVEINRENGNETITRNLVKESVTFFAWERLDLVDQLKSIFAENFNEETLSVS